MFYRTFLTRRFGIALVLAVLLPAGTRAQEAAPRILVASLEDQIIHPVTERFLLRALRLAHERNDQCIIIQLDTPGGLLDSTRHIVKEILTSNVPVIVYIAPAGGRAGSAGVFITLAAHLAVMAPGTNIGATHPIAMQGGPMPGGNDALGKIAGKPTDLEILSDKINDDPVAWARSLAEYRGRNADWAAHAIRDSISTTAKDALKERVIDILASDLNDLFRQLDERKINMTWTDRTVVLHTQGAVVERLEMSWPERLLSLLANPTLAYLLLLVGFSGVMFEITHPGVWIPGVLGLICLSLAFFAMQLLPINYAGLALIALGLLLVVLEVKVLSYGMLTCAGIVSLLLGSAMLIEPVGGAERVSWLVVAPVTIALALIMLFLVGNVVRAHRRKVQTGMESLVGAVARVNGDLIGQGYVRVAGELWRARSDLPLQDGETVRILGYEGLTLHVKPVLGDGLSIEEKH